MTVGRYVDGLEGLEEQIAPAIVPRVKIKGIGCPELAHKGGNSALDGLV
jgi:hypothetical protein